MYSFNISPDAGTKEEHREKALALLRETDWQTSHYEYLNSLYEYYHGIVDPQKDHNHLLMSSAGMMYPVNYIHVNEGLKYVDRMIGQLYMSGSNYGLRATSRQAVSRKHSKIIDMKVDHNLAPFLMQEQEMRGLPTMSPDTPLTPDELTDKISNYKDLGEIYYGRLLQDFIKRHRWDSWREVLFEDILVGGMAYIGAQISGIAPRPEYYDPRTVLVDMDCKDPWLRSPRYIGVMDYIPIPVAQALYGVSIDELKQMAKNSNSISLSGGRVPIMQNINNQDMVLRVRMEWMDTEEKMGFRYTSGSKNHYKLFGKEPSGNRDIGDTKGKRKKADGQYPLQYQVVRYCVLLGDRVVPDNCWGVLPNQVRTADDWQDTAFSIKGFVPRLKHGRNVSMLEEIIPWIKFKNEVILKIRQYMPKDKGKKMVAATDLYPDGLSSFDVEYISDLTGIIETQSRKYGGNAGYNQFHAVDFGLPASVQIYPQIIALINDEIQSITAQYDPRQNQQVGTGQIAMQDSAVRTNRLYAGFEIFNEIFLQHVMGLSKIATVEEPEAFAHIIGDQGMAYLQENIAHALDDFSIYATSLGPAERTLIQNMIPQAIGNQAVDFLTGMEVMLEKNPEEALNRLRAHRKKSEQRSMEAQQQEMAAAQQMQQATAQDKERDRMVDVATADADRAATIERARIMAGADIESQRQKGASQRLSDLSRERTEFRRTQAQLANAVKPQKE